MPVNARKFRILAGGCALAALAVPPSAVGQASAPVASPVQSISARDKQEGVQAHPQLLEEFGGAMIGTQPLAPVMARMVAVPTAIAVTVSVGVALQVARRPV